MRDGCPFPHCVLEDFHDGDHDFGRPYGALRQLQVFQVLGSVMCDLCPELPAKALYGDAAGKGWALCSFCEGEYSVRLEAA
jgi:hypothetical protein